MGRGGALVPSPRSWVRAGRVRRRVRSQHASRRRPLPARRRARGRWCGRALDVAGAQAQDLVRRSERARAFSAPHPRTDHRRLWLGRRPPAHGRRHPRSRGDARRCRRPRRRGVRGLDDGGYGNLVVVKHRLGFESWYAHLSLIVASEGEAVVGGTRIGYVGSTGHATGPHLHFEVRHFGTPIDPVPRLLAATASGARARTGTEHALACRPNADAWGTRDTDPFTARYGRCP
jgi:hypothetical protein